MAEDILIVKEMKKYFPTGTKGKYVKAIDGINFTLRKGEVLGLVGESGSGKSTTAYAIMGMHELTAGSILFKGKDLSISSKKRPLALKKDIQIVFQDPGTSLNRKREVRQIIGLPLRIHGLTPGRQIGDKIAELLEMVDLSIDYMYKYPSTLGGGERQLVAIARALATEPSMIVLDEPTSALDVSVQAKIINTLMRLRKNFQLSYLFITHDMSLMRNIADRIAIMYLGKIMEIAPTVGFFQIPFHPYTQMLISSIPVISKEERELKPNKVKSQGEIPSPVNIPDGCRFNTRCPRAFELCYQKEPEMVEMAPDHFVRCHLCSKNEKGGSLKQKA